MDKRKTGELIKEARTQKNYTQSELGELIGVSNKAVSRWENGESFPDVGVLERLSQVLDLKIQDIVTGERNQEDPNAFVEVVRMVKLQDFEKRRRNIKYILGILIIVYLCVLGLCGFSAYGTINVNWLIVYAVSYLAIIALALGSILFEKKKLQGKNAMSGISIITYILEVVILSICFQELSNGRTPLGMEPHAVGTVINVFLGVIYIINLLIFISLYYEMIKNDYAVNCGVFISAATLFLSGVNMELLHNISSFEVAWPALWINVGVISFEMCVAVILGVGFTRRKFRDKK